MRPVLLGCVLVIGCVANATKPMTAQKPVTAQEIMKHPFWRVKLTEAKAQAILDRANDKGNRSDLCIDDQGFMWDFDQGPRRASERSVVISCGSGLLKEAGRRGPPLEFADVKNALDRFMEREEYQKKYPR